MKKYISFILVMSLTVCLFVAGCTDKKKDKEETASEASLSLLPVYSEDGVKYSFRTSGEIFQVYGNDGEWKDIFPVGVNIGAGKPGYFPGEFGITKDEYLRWFKQISEMHADTIRVYTILMPEFYEALAEYNAKAEQPLYFMQGVYNNEDDIEKLNDAFAEDGKIANDWIAMCETIVDIVHGNAILEQEPGSAGGRYTADVSQYLNGWILGIEWQPEFVKATNENNPDKTEFGGKYIYTEGASPFEVFLASGLDACIAYETKYYGTQNPTAFANWVTTDPLTHPGEPNADLEDAVSVDAEHIKATAEFKAGLFASYHVYPYYPEMMRYAPELLTDDPVNSYKHYLQDLNNYHTIPVLISEFGIPAARGITHVARDAAFNQGGVTEEEQGNALVSMLKDIIDTGCAGACVFIWQDEWFKRTWNTMDYTSPENRPYWRDVQTSEQFFGLLSFDPGEQDICTIDGKADDWSDDKPLLTNGDTQLYIKSDESFLYMMVKGSGDNIQITLDTIEGQGNIAYDGADFSVEINGTEESRVQVDPYYDINYWLYASGLYSDKGILELQDGYVEPNTGRFAPIYLMLNRPLLLTDGTLMSTEQIETGKLRHGSSDPNSADYDSLADFFLGDNIIEIRLPWLLLNIPAPNAKQRIANLYAPKLSNLNMKDSVTLEPIDKIIFAINGEKASYSWEAWQEPAYHERLKQSYYILQDYLSGL